MMHSFYFMRRGYATLALLTKVQDDTLAKDIASRLEEDIGKRNVFTNVENDSIE